MKALSLLTFAVLGLATACGGHSNGSSTGGSSGTSGSGGTSSGSTSSSSSSSSGWINAPDCPGYVGPLHASPCACNGRHCGTNNCEEGDYCEIATATCVSPPYLCTIPPYDGGTPNVMPEVTWTGGVTADGGTVSTLYFAVVGDTRPADEDMTSEYPTEIINAIFQDIQQMNPEFVISTGDYQYADYSSSNGAAQLALYAQARAAYSGVLFPTMGNHECDGYTADNCDADAGTVSSGGSGTSNNYAAFKSTLLAPIHRALPYYAFQVNDAAGQWTAKFVVTAANAWDSAQQAWMTAVMAIPTTYTFVMRHESTADNTAPGVTPSDAILATNPYTLKIVGHSHYFSEINPQEVIVGNGGAPLDSSGDLYGYALVSMTTDGGNIFVQQMDFQSNTPVSSFISPK